MGAVIEFPCRAQVAANDDNPWLSAEPLPEPEPAKIESICESPYARRVKVVDKLSGVEYIVYVVQDEEKPASRVGLFVLPFAKIRVPGMSA